MVNKLSRLFTHRLSRRTPLQRPRLSSLPRTGVNCGFRVALGTPHWTPPTDHSMTSALFQPIQLRGLALENRVMVSPMCQYSAIDGCMTDWHFAHLGMLANSGAALLCFEMTDVEPIGRITPGCSGLYSDANEAALHRIVAFCRTHGQARLAIQLAHAGRKASTAAPWDARKSLRPEEGGWQPVAPSAIPMGDGELVPRALTRAEIKALVAKFADSVRRAERRLARSQAARRARLLHRLGGRRLGHRADGGLRPRVEEARLRLDRLLERRTDEEPGHSRRTGLPGAILRARPQGRRHRDHCDRNDHRGKTGRRHRRARQGGHGVACARLFMGSALGLARGARARRRAAHPAAVSARAPGGSGGRFRRAPAHKSLTLACTGVLAAGRLASRRGCRAYCSLKTEMYGYARSCRPQVTLFRPCGETHRGSPEESEEAA